MASTVPRIFIVDDDDAVRQSLRALLESYGFQVEDYQSGPAFFKSSSGMACACLVLDMNLPSMSGLEVLRRLRDGKSNLPVVMITGRSDAPTRRRAMEAGASIYIEKPVDGEQLVAAIRSLTN